MPVNSNYYRGQYNPYGSGYSAEIFSMYNPEAEARLTGAMQERQGRFDTALGAIAQESIRIADTESYDQALLTKRLEDFENKINNVVSDKYKGDYGAAASEIVKMIGQERANPFYQYNKQKVEAIKQYNQAKQQLGANFISAGNPYEVGYDQWQQGANFSFTPINKNDIVVTSQNVFQQIAKSMQNKPELLEETLGGQYFLIAMQNGFKNPEQVRAFLGTELGLAAIDQIKASMPELANIDQNTLMGAIIQGAYSAIGDTKVQFLQDQNFMSDLDLAKLQGMYGNGMNPIVPGGKTPIEMNKSDFLTSPMWAAERDKIAKILAKQHNISGVSSWEDLNKVITNTDNVNKWTGLREAAYALPGIGGIVGKFFDNKLSTIDTKSQPGLRREAKDMMDQIYGGPDKSIMNWKISKIISADPDNITKNQKIANQLDIVVEESIGQLKTEATTSNKTSRKGLKNISSDIHVDEFGIDQSGLYLGLTGKDAEGKPTSARFIVDDPYFLSEVINYISQMQPMFLQHFLNNYLAPLAETNPEKYNEYMSIMNTQSSYFDF